MSIAPFTTDNGFDINKNSVYDYPLRLIDNILSKICQIQLEKFTLRRNKRLDWEIETNLIDFITSEQRYKGERIEEVIKRFETITIDGPGNKLSKLLNFIFGTNLNINEDFTTYKEDEGSKNMESDKNIVDIKLDKNNEKWLLCNRGDFIYNQIADFLNNIHWSRPNHSIGYFLKHCLSNYEEILKRELLDLHELRANNFVCDRTKLVNYLTKYCKNSGYKLNELIIIPLYDVWNIADYYLNSNCPTLMCIFYVNRICERTNKSKSKSKVKNKNDGESVSKKCIKVNNKSVGRNPIKYNNGTKSLCNYVENNSSNFYIENKTNVMFGLITFGNYSIIEDGKFEAIIPISPLYMLKSVNIYTTTFVKKVNASQEEDCQEDIDDEDKDNLLEKIFRCKLTFLKPINKKRECVEISQMIRPNKYKTSEIKVKITILKIYVRGKNHRTHFIHSPFLNENQLFEILSPVYRKIDRNHEEIQNKLFFNDFLKRCYIHMGSNLIFI